MHASLLELISDTKKGSILMGFPQKCKASIYDSIILKAHLQECELSECWLRQ